MRMTNSIRSAFVKSVMSDTPEVDYTAQLNEFIFKHAENTLPLEMTNLLRAKPEMRKLLALNHYGVSLQVDDKTNYFSGYAVGRGGSLKFSNDATATKLLNVLNLRAAQNQARKTLKEKVTATIAQFTTVKQAIEALPEFAKYLPDLEEKPIKTLPVVTGMVTALMQAGFPEKKKKKAAA